MKLSGRCCCCHDSCDSVLMLSRIHFDVDYLVCVADAAAAFRVPRRVDVYGLLSLPSSVAAGTILPLVRILQTTSCSGQKCLLGGGVVSCWCCENDRAVHNAFCERSNIQVRLTYGFHICNDESVQCSALQCNTVQQFSAVMCSSVTVQAWSWHHGR